MCFSTYAYKCIKYEILNFLRKNKNNNISLEENFYNNLKLNDALIDTKTDIVDDLIKKENINLVLEYINNNLNSLEKYIFYHSFGINCDKLNQIEISKFYNISQSKVSKIKNKIIKNIKTLVN